MKSRFHDEKKIIKEILKEKDFEVGVDTTFDQFATVICEDRRSATLDAGNVKLTFNSFLEKVRIFFLIISFLDLNFMFFQAEAKEKERLKEESKRMKKLEMSFKSLLRDLNIDYEQSWDDVRGKLEKEDEFLAFDSESDRIRVYKVS